MGGAMTWVSERHLVAAISNAGGFGVIASGSMTPELLDVEIAATYALTARPFAVNLITLHPKLMELIGRTMDDIERWAIEETLKLTNGNREEAAKVLAIGARTLYRKLEKYQSGTSGPVSSAGSARPPGCTGTTVIRTGSPTTAPAGKSSITGPTISRPPSVVSERPVCSGTAASAELSDTAGPTLRVYAPCRPTMAIEHTF